VISGFLNTNRTAPTLWEVRLTRPQTDSSAVTHRRIHRQQNETRPLRRLLVPVPPQTKALKKRWNEQVRNSTDCSIKVFVRLRHKRSMASGSSQLREHGPPRSPGETMRGGNRVDANSSLTRPQWRRDYYDDPRRIT